MTIDEYLDSIEIPYEERTTATNNFADENLISQGRSTGVKLYKGQLISKSGQLTNILARLYGVSKAAHNEVLISYWVNNKNIHSIFKISESCDDDEILISKYVANGSLNKYLSDSQTLTWMQRLHICVGVAHALSYLHNDVTVGSNGRSIIHGNIKSSKILLDDNWEPKLYGFRYSMTAKTGDVHRPSEYWDKSGYRDPT
ncbi:cysteine-rich receptor-like protein kinase 3 [Rutidosis leptorrhynchoides]|uniref:cysteine-rich receptor-like protein kinase 3 n=1 Tax=Rutidosis leptorrhynchoides TaxID=125765 RepID=UPI003A99FB11